MIPKLISCDFGERIAGEELVAFKPKKEWNKEDYEKVIDKVFADYKNYYLDCSLQRRYSYMSVEIVLRIVKGDLSLSEIANVLEKRIPEDFQNMKFPEVRQHGDLWLYNVLLGANSKKSVYFIDWEHAGQYFFYMIYSGGCKMKLLIMKTIHI